MERKKAGSGFKMKSPIKKDTKEYTSEQKLKAVKGFKKHGGKKGYQEYVDKVFGGPTKIEGMKSTTTIKKS